METYLPEWIYHTRLANYPNIPIKLFAKQITITGKQHNKYDKCIPNYAFLKITPSKRGEKP
jgi:hypothetical protein